MKLKDSVESDSESTTSDDGEIMEVGYDEQAPKNDNIDDSGTVILSR